MEARKQVLEVLMLSTLGQIMMSPLLTLYRVASTSVKGVEDIGCEWGVVWLK